MILLSIRPARVGKGGLSLAAREIIRPVLARAARLPRLALDGSGHVTAPEEETSTSSVLAESVPIVTGPEEWTAMASRSVSMRSALMLPEQLVVSATTFFIVSLYVVLPRGESSGLAEQMRRVPMLTTVEIRARSTAEATISSDSVAPES